MSTHRTMEWPRAAKAMALGRNGYMACCGAEACLMLGQLRITPVNSKGETGRSFLEVPETELPALIRVLREIEVSRGKGKAKGKKGPVTLKLLAEFPDAKTAEEARVSLDAFRESTLPDLEHGITLYEDLDR